MSPFMNVTMSINMNSMIASLNFRLLLFSLFFVLVYDINIVSYIEAELKYVR